MKVGDVYWECTAWSDENNYHVDLDQWKVRAIRRPPFKAASYKRIVCAFPKVYITQVNEYTWIKENGVMGWASSISNLYRKNFNLGGELPFGIYTTRLQALRDNLEWLVKRTEAQEKWIEAEYTSWSIKDRQEEMIDLKENKRMISLIKSRITREQRI